jgi:hypothetical protein
LRTELEPWCLPVTAARLNEGVGDEERALVREVARLARRFETSLAPDSDVTHHPVVPPRREDSDDDR